MTSVLRFAASALTLLAAAAAFGDAKATHTGVAKSARVELRFRPDSWAAAHVESTLDAAERDLDRVAKALDVKPVGPFLLFVYDDVAELAAITGTSENCGFTKDNEVHVPYANDQTRLHEFVHAVAHQLPRAGVEPRSPFFQEGLANAVVEYVDGVHVHAAAAFHLKRGELPPLADVTTGDFYAWVRARPRVDTYDIAASWMRFLWDRFGVEKLKRYYAGAPAKDVFDAYTAELEASWREMLTKYPLRKETETFLRARAGEPVGFEPYVKGLPASIVGKASDWAPLLGEKLALSDLAKWNRENGVVTGTNPSTEWTTCEFKTIPYGDCAVRARIKTTGYCALSVQLGRGNRAILAGPGTFIFRDDKGMAQSGAVAMTAAKTETDFVLVRRGAELEVWIDGVKALTGPAVVGPARPGIGVAQGTATFVDVQVRWL